MDTQEYLPILKDRFGGSIRGNALITECPMCGKKDHFYVYANPGGLNSLCYKCGYKMSRYGQFINKYNYNDLRNDANKFVTRKMLITSELPAVWHIGDSEFDPAYRYLVSRGVSEGRMYRYNFGLGKEAPWIGRVVFYVLDDNGSVLLVGGRVIDKQTEPRYYYPSGSPKSECLFNLTHIPAEYDYVVIMEGPFDVICSGVPNAVALMGSVISDKQLTLLAQRFSRYVVWLDSPSKDVTAWHKANVLAKRLLEQGVVKIVNQQYGSDPGDCPDPSWELLQAKDYSLVDWVKYNMSRKGGEHYGAYKKNSY